MADSMGPYDIHRELVKRRIRISINTVVKYHQRHHGRKALKRL